MKPRQQVDPADPAEAHAEICRLELAARRAVINARRAGKTETEYFRRWSEARERLSALRDAEVPDVVAARAAWRTAHHVTDEQASAGWARGAS